VSVFIPNRVVRPTVISPGEKEFIEIMDDKKPNDVIEGCKVDRSRELLHGAYAALVKENERLKLDRDNAMAQFFGLQNKASEGIIALEKEITSLRESLKLAVETLDVIEKAYPLDGDRMTHQDYALKALATIKAKGEL